MRSTADVIAQYGGRKSENKQLSAALRWPKDV